MMMPLAFLFHTLNETTATSLPGPGDWWSFHHWTWELSITLPLAIFAMWYLIGSIRRENTSSLRWRHLAFWSGWFALCVALVSPLHQLGDALFSAHMLQHEILLLVSAPLIAASHCSVTLLYALPIRKRRRIGGIISAIERHPVITWITAPLCAFLLHAITLWGWHIPALYQATIESDAVHAAQHLCFFFTGLVFWSALYGAGRSTMSYGAAVLYTFGTAVHCSALGALLTFSTVLWYPIYADRTAAWNMTALQDQQLGGLLMWVPSGVIFILIGIVLTARWIQTSSERARHATVVGIEEAR